MPGSVIHVYHGMAEHLAKLVAEAAPERSVIALASSDALAAALPEIEVLFAPAPPRTGWAKAKQLRLIQLLGVGADTLLPSADLPPAVEIGVMRGAFSADVAEHALALMLAHTRRLAELLELQRTHRFIATPRPTLAGKHLVIVGHGSVGRRLARASRALDMRVTAVSRTGRTAPDEIDGVTVVAAERLAEVLPAAAFVVIACPLTPATRGMFGAAMLAQLPPQAYVISVARGGIVDETALVDALSAGRLAGAALDVFAQEPLPADSPLWETPGLAITPHVAGLGEEYLARCIEALLANVSALGSGRPRTGLVDRHVGY
jgi:phosphoglycerate dehydrogenase-like enzyme